MKKRLIILLILSFALCSCFAANQLFTFGFETGWNNGIQGPFAGFHTFYHFGASITEKTEVGVGTLVDVDLGIMPLSSGESKATLSLSLGPSFTTDINTNVMLNAMIGPWIDVYKNKNTDDGSLGLGIGGAVSFTFIPTHEKSARVQMGFTLGLIASATANVDNDPVGFVSAKTFFGFSTVSPAYYPYYGYDIYSDVLTEIYEAY